MQILSSLPSIIDINAVMVKLCDSDRGPSLLRHGVDDSPTRRLNFTIIYCVLAMHSRLAEIPVPNSHCVILTQTKCYTVKIPYLRPVLLAMY